MAVETGIGIDADLPLTPGTVKFPCRPKGNFGNIGDGDGPFAAVDAV